MQPVLGRELVAELVELDVEAPQQLGEPLAPVRDDNIFLMSRAREESLEVGARQGILRALAVTGG